MMKKKEEKDNNIDDGGEEKEDHLFGVDDGRSGDDSRGVSVGN